jgi:SAM-dependent methyltransferase
MSTGRTRLGPQDTPNFERVKADAASASLYARRKPGKHRSEMRMVEAALAMLPKGNVQSVLDAPCGVGRLCVLLARQGYQVTGIDLGEAAVRLTHEALSREELDARIEVQNILSMDFSEREFDCSICFRLLHHFQHREHKARLINELCRVSDRFVIISYFSPVSVTTLRRRIRRLLTGKPLKQYPDSPSELDVAFARNGFQLRGRVKRSPRLHSLQLAVFERR